MFPVDKKALVELLTSLGVDTAKDWDVQVLQEKVNTNGITYYLPSTGLPELDADAKFLLGECMERQSRGEKLEVIADPLAYISQPVSTSVSSEPEKTAEAEDVTGSLSTETNTEAISGQADVLPGPEPFPPPAKQKKQRTSREPAKERKSKPHKTQKKAKKWKPKILSVTDRGAGVTRTIIEELQKAGKEGKPITKSKLLKIMVKAFPNRPDGEKKMKTTIDNLLGSKLKSQYGIDVQKTKTLTKVNNRCANCGHKVVMKRGERQYWIDTKGRQVG